MEKTSESQLIEIGKWAYFGVKIAGFCPCSFKTRTKSLVENKSISFSFLSHHVIYPLVLLTALISWDFVFFWRQNAFKKHLQARGATELYAYNLMTGIGSVLGIYLMISGIRNHQNFINFWKATCQLIDQLKACSSSSSTTIKFKMHPLEQSWFTELEKSRQKAFLSLIIPVTLHVILVYGYLIVESILDEDGTLDDTHLAIGLGFWTFFALIASSISIWMTFFIQVYTACFKSVEESLKSLGKSRVSVENEEDMDVFLKETLVSSILSHSISKEYAKFTKRNSNSFNDFGKLEQNVETNIQMFQSILREIENFNDVFGNILIFEMGACVVNLLVYLFFALIWLGRSQFGLLLEGIVPIYVYGKELYDIGTFSEDLTGFAERVIRTFSEDVSLEHLTPPVHLRLQILVTQTSTNPPTISAKQFFVINRGFVTSILSALATFLVVLVQFRDADVPE